MNSAKPYRKQRIRAKSPRQVVLSRQFALYRAGKTQKAIAIELNVSPAAIAAVLSGAATSQRIAEHLSKVTGIGLDKLYPDNRYTIKSENAL